VDLLPVSKDTLSPRGRLAEARRLLGEAARAAREKQGTEACRIARIAAREAIHAVLEALGVQPTGSLVAGIQLAVGAGVHVPSSILRYAHILDPYMYDATRHGAGHAGNLASHGGECREAAEGIVEWAESVYRRASRS
jgi:HEPN domain-containing protein